MLMEGLLGLVLLANPTQEVRKVDTPPAKVTAPKSGADRLTPITADALLARSSVRVSRKSPSGNGQFVFSKGSGTVVRKDNGVFYVLTCSHVAHGGTGREELTVTHSSKTYPAKLLVYCPVRDLALLECRGDTEAVPAAIAPADTYRAGSVVYRCGYPLAGSRKTVRCTVVRRMAHISGYPHVRLLTATPTSISGDSGGGMFRASDGKLVGVNFAGGNGTMSAANLESVWKLLNYSGVKVGVETLPAPTPEVKKEKVSNLADINSVGRLVVGVKVNSSPMAMFEVIELTKSLGLELTQASLGVTSHVCCKVKGSLGKDGYDKLTAHQYVLFVEPDRVLRFDGPAKQKKEK